MGIKNNKGAYFSLDPCKILKYGFKCNLVDIWLHIFFIWIRNNEGQFMITYCPQIPPNFISANTGFYFYFCLDLAMDSFILNLLG